MEDQAIGVPCVLSDDTHGRGASGTTAHQGNRLDTVDNPYTATADDVGPEILATGLGDHQNESSHIGISAATEPSTFVEEDAVGLNPDVVPDDDPHFRSGDEEYQSDHEREAEIRHEFTTELRQHRGQGPARLVQQREAGRKRGLQASQFLIAIEDRVRELEYEVKRLQKTQDEKVEETEAPADVEADDPSKEISAGFLLKPAKLAWSDFSLPLHLRVSKEQSTIDVLIEKPHSFGQKLNPFGIFDREPPSLPASQSHRRRRQSGLGQASGPVERLRFSSFHLEQVFEDILGGDIPLQTPGAQHQLRPFKAIIPYTNELRVKLSEFEQLIAEQDEKVTNPTGGEKAFQATSGDGLSTGVKPDEADTIPDEYTSDRFRLDTPRHDLIAMRDHTKTLVGCFETTLLAEISSYTQLRSRLRVDGQSIKVVFTDLWYLFAPGDLVYDHTSGQAMRVLSVRGGRSYLVDEVSLPPPERYDTAFDSATGQYVETRRPQRLKATDMQADFVLTCFYLSFNGTHFGPVQKDVVIDPFEGSTAIDSLAVMPIEYAKDSTFLCTQPRSGQATSTEHSLHDALLARGRLYADLARPGEAGELSSHRLYIAFRALTASFPGMV
jgi:hypothetical protein